MEKQTVYTTIAMEGSPLDKKIQEMVKYARLEKHENVYVFTEAEYKEHTDAAILLGRTLEMDFNKQEQIEKAFDAGYNFGVCLYPCPNKTEYLNSLKP